MDNATRCPQLPQACPPQPVGCEHHYIINVEKNRNCKPTRCRRPWARSLAREPLLGFKILPISVLVSGEGGWAKPAQPMPKQGFRFCPALHRRRSRVSVVRASASECSCAVVRSASNGLCKRSDAAMRSYTVPTHSAFVRPSPSRECRSIDAEVKTYQD